MALDLATTNNNDQVEAKGEDFQLPGVFAMVGERESKSTNIIQFAFNQDGIIRSNDYNALTDTTEPVFGSVDKWIQWAAWTVGDRQCPVYEAGIANLTKDETTLLGHPSRSSSQQLTLIRIQQLEGISRPASSGPETRTRSGRYHRSRCDDHPQQDAC